MSNKYLGTVDFVLGDKTYILRYDWNAISEIKSKYGQDVLTRLNEVKPDELADIVAIGLRADKVTAEDVCNISPPLLPTMKTLLKAFEYSYYGPEGAPPDEPDSKKNPE